MARLIDADAYAAEMRKRQDNCRAWKDSLDEGTEQYARAEQSFITFVEAALTLKKQPTIDAIPVEWLREKIKEHTDEEGWQDYLANSFGLCIEEWQQEQEGEIVEFQEVMKQWRRF